MSTVDNTFWAQKSITAAFTNISQIVILMFLAIFINPLSFLFLLLFSWYCVRIFMIFFVTLTFPDSLTLRQLSDKLCVKRLLERGFFLTFWATNDVAGMLFDNLGSGAAETERMLAAEVENIIRNFVASNAVFGWAHVIVINAIFKLNSIPMNKRKGEENENYLFEEKKHLRSNKRNYKNYKNLNENQNVLRY